MGEIERRELVADDREKLEKEKKAQGLSFMHLVTCCH